MNEHVGSNPVLITVDELQSAINSGNAPLLFDVRWQLGGDAETARADYRAAHIRGAVFVDLEAQLTDPTGGEGRHPLPCPDHFERTARRLGVCNDRSVVVYDGGSGMAASRLWWLLVDSGHPDVRVLDGGLAAWQQAGHDVESGVNKPREGWFIAEPGQLDSVTADDVADTDATVWDVRAAERYRGEVEPIDPVAGHIPGARNLPMADLLVDGHLRPAEELRDHLAEVADGDILYCGSGITAGQMAWALHSIGRTDVSIYFGSWSDWVSDPSRPVEVSEPVTI